MEPLFRGFVACSLDAEDKMLRSTESASKLRWEHYPPACIR
jgi:hypothetical protein